MTDREKQGVDLKIKAIQDVISKQFFELRQDLWKESTTDRLIREQKEGCETNKTRKTLRALHNLTIEITRLFSQMGSMDDMLIALEEARTELTYYGFTVEKTKYEQIEKDSRSLMDSL